MARVPGDHVPQTPNMRIDQAFLEMAAVDLRSEHLKGMELVRERVDAEVKRK